jgi:hypothetical protein
MWEAGVFALMLLLFLAFLRYLVQERAGGSESGRLSAPQRIAQRSSLQTGRGCNDTLVSAHLKPVQGG